MIFLEWKIPVKERATIKRKTNSKKNYYKSCHRFFHLEIRLCKNKSLYKRMRRLVCEKLSCGTTSPKMVTGCLRKLIERSNNPRQPV